ncbi:ParA family protein [Shigella sonnei]|uniref:AAA domain-containing protein n=1 Tax=Escherichia coli TaxID=562 RepID=A0A1V2GC12_ECOLX|nr:ParA family protein [Escherichia coli]EDW6767789.1 ParA family protein [Salmonella enterica subsp. enterica serovar Johannesburg]EFV9881529.1 ParA family protein [Shigella sonnei]EKJ2619655.1 ParA family protein [Shigella flexneri]HAC8092453.1 ParA family protein [Salmonella enterica subsp. enterica serovar Enteritidis]HBN2914252.1 ParA family protein [Escherichia coli O25b:H4-ST131]
MAKKPSSFRRSLLSKAIIQAIKRVRPVICTGNGKGGVGKSTNAMHLASAAAEAGLKTLLIDNDEHTTFAAFGSTSPDMPEYAFSSDLFTPEGITKPILQLEQLGGCWFLPRDNRLEEINSTPLESGIVLYPHQHIQKLREEFDIIIIDSPPGKGNLQQATFLCATTAAMITELSEISVNGVVTAITVTEELVSILNEGETENLYSAPKFVIVPNKFNPMRPQQKAHYETLISYELLMTAPIYSRSTMEKATDALVPVWKYKDGNARQAAKEVKAAIKFIISEAVK